MIWPWRKGSTKAPPPEAAKDSPKRSGSLVAPDWTPSDEASRRLAAFAQRVARDLRAAGGEGRREGANYWVVSYDVSEAIQLQYPRDYRGKYAPALQGWSQGNCLLLFTDGKLGTAYWFGEVDPRGPYIEMTDISPPNNSSHRWSDGNLSRWRQGGGGMHPEARYHYKGFWPQPRKELNPWEGASRLLKRFSTTKSAALPRYYLEDVYLARTYG